MTLSRDEISVGLIDELNSFRNLVAGLSPSEWSQPTRCAGWTVADVAAHVIGSMADVTAGRLEGLGSPEVTEREVAERRGRTPTELAEELAGVTKLATDMLGVFDDSVWATQAPGGYDGTLGQGVEALWFDTFVHGEDIRSATGRAPERGPGVRASVHHIVEELGKRKWGPAILRLDGIEVLAIGGDIGTAGRTVSGDPLAFVLIATGRADPSGLGLDASVNIYS
ncbi:MAG: maleylpyruvate isomerase family mycothiol-dependent enzyme [Acidimicrobiales bacterium]